MTGHVERSARRLGVVVVNYGSHVLLAENPTLRAAGNDPAAMCVVVDNFTSLDERDAVEELCRRRGWDLVALPSNRGFGAGANAGAAFARRHGCDVLLLLNPDASIDWASAVDLADRCRLRPLSALSPVIERPDGSVWFRGGRIDLATGALGAALASFESGPASWLTGACLFVGGSLWDRLGGFDERYFLYWEDVDLSRRCVELGGSLCVAADTIAHHDVGATQRAAGSSGAKSPTYYYYNCRNRLSFAAGHLPPRAALRWCAATPVQSWRILLRGGGRRTVVTSPRAVGAALAGSIAGLGVVVAALARRGLRRRGASEPAITPATASRATS